MFGKELYYISILGKPSEKDPWMLQFGGHHLALNITIAGEHGVLTPTLTGAQPAIFTKDGKTVRPLGGESIPRIAGRGRFLGLGGGGVRLRRPETVQARPGAQHRSG